MTEGFAYTPDHGMPQEVTPRQIALSVALDIDDMQRDIRRRIANTPSLRRGQAAFNVLSQRFPFLAEEVQRGELDPYYDDSKVPALLEWVRQRLLQHAEARKGEPHTYFSTSCFHSEHEYCKGETGACGAKVPAQCKFCAAPCVCPCHKAQSAT